MSVGWGVDEWHVRRDLSVRRRRRHHPRVVRLQNLHAGFKSGRRQLVAGKRCRGSFRAEAAA